MLQFDLIRSSSGLLTSVSVSVSSVSSVVEIPGLPCFAMALCDRASQGLRRFTVSGSQRQDGATRIPGHHDRPRPALISSPSGMQRGGGTLRSRLCCVPLVLPAGMMVRGFTRLRIGAGAWAGIIHRDRLVSRGFEMYSTVYRLQLTAYVLAERPTSSPSSSSPLPLSPCVPPRRFASSSLRSASRSRICRRIP